METQFDAVNGKRFPQEGRRMGDRTERKEWGDREKRTRKSRRTGGKLEVREGEKHKAGRKGERDARDEENFKRTRKGEEQERIDREDLGYRNRLPIACRRDPGAGDLCARLPCRPPQPPHSTLRSCFL